VKRVKSTPDGIQLHFNAAEADVLSDIAEQLVALLASVDDVDDLSGDEALSRLLPDGYRDSPEDADEFRRFTQTELVDDKVAGAASIVGALSERDEVGRASPLLSPVEAVVWLRSLNDIRLAFAARLGIVSDDSIPQLDTNDYAIFRWLGEVQYLLLRAVDR